jgi:hypothetical protein
LSLDKYDAENQRELVHPVLIIGEGKADASFLSHLFEARQLGSLHFGFPSNVTGGFGAGAIGRYLASLPTRAGFNSLRIVIVVFDNDSNPAAQFQSIRDQIDPNDPYTTPDQPLDIPAAEPDKVRLLFIPMPGIGMNGALESLLLQSTSAHGGARACVDALTVCAGCNDWSTSHDAKMRLRCLIAVKCQGNSDMALTNIWNKPGNPIDLAHACFDPFVQKVREAVALA